jgi:rSAM/selenodomain-associated transferase 2
MTISVIIPTLNEQAVLTQALARTAALGFSDIIVADGGSTDETVHLAEACCAHAANVRVITAPRGRARQMNEGAKASRGKTLLFLHADTQLPDDAGRIIESALTDLAVQGGRFDVRFDHPSAWGRTIGMFMNWRSRLSGIATGDQAMFVRRHVFEQLGGFADIPLMEDIEFSRRLKRTGRIVALHETVTTSFRRWERQGPLRTILLMWAIRFLYWIGVSPHRLKRFYTAVR